jgi:hypothetical protein
MSISNIIVFGKELYMHPFSNRLKGRLLAAFLLLVICLSTGAVALAQQQPALPSPTLLTPPAAFTTSNSRPTLSWQAVPEAESYEIIVANNREFLNARQIAQVVNGTRYTTSELANGTYYWHVRAVLADGKRGPWSAPLQFTVDINYPVRKDWMGETWIAVPQYGVTGDPTGKIVINELCAGCWIFYRAGVELYNADVVPVDMTNWKLSIYASASTLSIVYYFPPGFTLPPGAYVTVYEGPGANTSNALYMGTSIILPYANSDFRGAIALQSTAPTGIDFVRFRSSYFGSNTIAPPTGTTWIGPDPLSNQSEMSFGRDAQSLDTNKGTDWVEQLDTLELKNDPAVTAKPSVAPVQVLPAASASVNDVNHRFSWNSVPNARTFRVEISTLATCATTAFFITDIPGLSTAPPPGALVDGVYYWRVRAENTLGVGSWSTCRKYTLDNVAPTVAPVLTAPINGAVVSLPKPTLKWGTVAGSARYEVGLELNDSVEPEIVGQVTTTTFVPPNNLVTGHYYWYVRALDAAGNAGPWSGGAVPEDFVLLSSGTSAPVLNQFSSVMVQLNWVGVSWANAYEIQVDNNSTFNSLEYDEQDIPRNYENWVVGPLPADGLYYWRIRARKDDNTWGTWSKTQTFYVNVP